MSIDNLFSVPKAWATSVLLATVILLGEAASAQQIVQRPSPRQQAYKIFTLLTGSPPSDAKLSRMERMLVAGEKLQAALEAIDDESGLFYEVTLRRIAAKWTNVDNSPRVTFNDGIALVLGLVAADEDFRQVLFEDRVYVGNSEYPGVTKLFHPYSTVNNDHYASTANNATYQSITQAANELSVPIHKLLIAAKQSDVSNLLAPGTSGFFTTRAGAEAYLLAGTNRRAVGIGAMEKFWCRSIDELASTTRPHFIAQDVPRDPGGDAGAFINTCAGCHSVQDGLRAAYAYHDFTTTAGVIYTPGTVVAKVVRNAHEFPEGMRATSDAWRSNWGPEHDFLGWPKTTSGNGIKSMNKAFADSRQFSVCMAETALSAVCDVDAKRADLRTLVENLANGFEKTQYNMRQLFANAVLTCTVD